MNTTIGIAVTTFAVATSLLFAQDAATAQTAISQADVEEQNNLSDPEAVVSATEMVEEWKEAALAQLKVDEGITSDGKYVVFAAANVALKDTDPQYGDALASAFDWAMNEAQSKMLMDRFGRIATQKVQEAFRDQSTNAREIPVELPTSGDSTFDKAARVIDKTLSLSEAKLDKALEEYGVSREEYASVPVEKKKTLFKNALLKETIKSAAGEIGGLFPVQTTVKKDAKGNTKVGVILIMSPKSTQIAMDIRLQRRSLVKGKGANLKAKMTPKSNEKWIGQLGTRLVYDQDGTPAIVSYGMGAFVPDGDEDYINDELKEEARKQAMDNADAQIAEVVAGRMSTQSSRMQGESVEKLATREMKFDAPTYEKTVKEIVKQSRSFAKSQAKMEMKGLTTLGSKFIKLPSGQTMCYVIRCWSYTGLDAANGLNGIKPPASSSESQHGSASDNDGFQVNDIEDF